MSSKATKRKPAEAATQVAPVKRAKAPAKPPTKAKASKDIDDIFSTISTKNTSTLKPATADVFKPTKNDKPKLNLAKSVKSSTASTSKPTTQSKPVIQQSVIPEDDLGFTRSSQSQQQAKSASAVSRSAGDLKIYDIDSLGMGKGQDTPLCPFDCECCV